MNLGDMWRRSDLRRAAQRYADWGWPVVPGAVLSRDRYSCGPLCPTVACHPATARWEAAASSDPADVDTWWSAHACSVLLATGRAFDVLEVPARLGSAVVARRRRRPSPRPDPAPAPVAVTPSGRWMFLVRTGDGLRPELAAQLDIVLHGSGSWIPAPPTRTLSGPVHWHTRPGPGGWVLPDPYAVQQEMVEQLRLNAATPAGAPRHAAAS